MALATWRTGPEHGVGVVRREGRAHRPPGRRRPRPLWRRPSSAMPAIGRLRDQLARNCACRATARRRRCAARRARRGSSRDRRRRRRPSRRWRRRSSERSPGAPPAPRPETSWAKSGPMISSAPSCSALSAAARAPSGVPLVSFGTSDTFGLSKSNSASSAACFSALATAGVDARAGERQEQRDLHRAGRAGDAWGHGPGPLPPPRAASGSNAQPPGWRARASRPGRSTDAEWKPHDPFASRPRASRALALVP